jgi:hypothetical protein
MEGWTTSIDNRRRWMTLCWTTCWFIRLASSGNRRISVVRGRIASTINKIKGSRKAFIADWTAKKKLTIRMVSIRTMHLESAGSIPARDMKKKSQTGIRWVCTALLCWRKIPFFFRFNEDYAYFLFSYRSVFYHGPVFRSSNRDFLCRGSLV